MNEKECELYRSGINKQLQVHDVRLNNHSDRIDKLEQAKERTDVKIENLIDNMQGLTKTMKWFVGLQIGSYISFFFYVIQHKLF